MNAYRIELARRADAAIPGADGGALRGGGPQARLGAARVGWHIRDADSVVLTARHGPAVAGFAIMRYGMSART